MRNFLRSSQFQAPIYFSLVLALSACGSAPPPEATAPEETSEPAKQEPKVAEEKHGELANASLSADMHAAPAPNTEGVLKSTRSKASSFDVNAPATVLVTTRWGHGSGVVIDPKGRILTNYHVIEAGVTEEFTIEVGVKTAKINDDGSANPDKAYRARALKIDPKRDLALLQLVDFDGKLPAAPLADAKRPRAGHKVSAIGNAGVGFGWAIKHCHINAIGTMEHAAKAIFMKDGAAIPESVRKQQAEAIARAAKDAGLQIQTDCNILPGDSGGPLIDEETHELVGLNVAIRTSTSGSRSLGSVSFHIHIKEIQDFLQDVPEKPVSFLPDPWELAGHRAALNDTDHDGEVDSLRVHGKCGAQHLMCHGLFLDADQDSFSQGKKVPKLQKMYEERSFDAEWIGFRQPRMPRGNRPGRPSGPVTDALLYFDSDNDGVMDRLLIRDGELRKARGYQIKDGTLERDKSLDALDASLDKFFGSDKDRENFRHFQNAHESVTGSAARATRRSAAVDVKPFDHTSDGKTDTVLVETRLDERFFIDLDQDSLPGLKGEGLQNALKEGEVDAELVAVTTTPYRVWYDSDADGQLDLLLEGANLERGFALGASSVDAKGKLTPAAGHVGRRMLRPGLMGDSKAAGQLELLLGRAFPEKHAEVDDLHSTFPSGKIGRSFRIEEYEGTDRRAISVIDGPRIVVFFDLDGDTFKKANKDKTLAQVIRENSFDAEFVFIYDGALSWALYDTKGDSKFDEVRVGRSRAPKRALHLYSIGKSVEYKKADGKVEMFDVQPFAKKWAWKKKFEELKKAVVAQ